MSVLHRTRTAPADPAVPASRAPDGPTATPAASGSARTRLGPTWLRVCAVGVTSVVLLVFMLQNTRDVEVTFLWMHGTLPLVLALLIAGVGMAVLAMVVGAVRLTRRDRRQH
ncbi:lipopolysaccharide assembly LapA domain-containing protein [Plantactinospora solaniradicis]|uniref:Lipopolysaccharide assembly LapA domain-containing protein n=1 Tax=Plantactinospora solaniradicis TaxID=1723736 RepID=A0ABW1K478_9ACTN